MPTRKQRRRRQKEQRHEYEFVTYDDEGQEIPVDSAELKAPKEKSSNGRPAAAAKGRTTQARDRKGRPLREVKPPSWRAAIKRAAIFVVVLAVFLSFVGGKKQSPAVKILLPLFYGVVGVPFFYWMDRAAYRRYLRATGREDEIPTGRRSPRR
ncbi:MAG: hypothetical protein E6G08_11410 [Actinobacteria bacterium]|nr:MAG: hypothetical protein E6G08_11410 [Actinomycetota bacterium]